MAINRKALKPYSASGKSTGPNLQGVWQNELGSTMTITSFDGTTFSGTYASAVSSGGGSVSGTLAGTLAGDAVGFIVNWKPAFSSVTSWSGIVLTSGDALAIYSLWHLASTPESDADYWESITAGADLFVQN
jgi:avidin family protein